MGVLLASCGLAAGAETNRPIAVPKEPVIEIGFVGSPEFETRSGKFSAGTAFLAKLQGEANPLLITAQHIFGSAGGLETEVPREQMAGFSKRATLHDLVKGKSHTMKIDSLALSGTIDVAAFRTTPGGKVKAHPFANENPKEGDTLWLVASLEGQPEKRILHRGSVVAVWADKIKCKFDDGKLVMRGSSGAPYVNAQGEVVGLHTGSYKDPGNISGSLVPVETITRTIKSALELAATRKAQKK